MPAGQTGLVHLVRHADAPARATWPGPDLDRPLSARGARQAAGIAERLAHRRIVRLVSSPARRCVSTLEPLGHVLELAVEDAGYLAEGSDAPAALGALVAERPGAEVVACTHGDVVSGIVAAALAGGASLEGGSGAPKAVTFTLSVVAGRVAAITAVAPPHR